jgi:hypothetical protein
MITAPGDTNWVACYATWNLLRSDSKAPCSYQQIPVTKKGFFIVKVAKKQVLLQKNLASLPQFEKCWGSDLAP